MSHTKRILKPATLPVIGRMYHGDPRCHTEWVFLDVREADNGKHLATFIHKVANSDTWARYDRYILNFSGSYRQHLHEID